MRWLIRLSIRGAEKRFFFEKKKQKTFGNWARAGEAGTGPTLAQCRRLKLRRAHRLAFSRKSDFLRNGFKDFF
jgi:hypothetical protein